MSDSIFVLLIIFGVVVLPYWLKLHYQKNKTNPSTKDDVNIDELQSLKACAEDLEQRVQNLESILDVEAPNWRRKYG
ncbi:MAG: envelope stress response membrane protein PspB [Gammaproteobacteria bacterium]|nr:envelope stress response membrane protein PspB [Gammaproteobacteria bacterium]